MLREQIGEVWSCRIFSFTFSCVQVGRKQDLAKTIELAKQLCKEGLCRVSDEEPGNSELVYKV